MTEVRRYRVLDGFVPGLPEYDWIQPGQTYEGERASEILPADIPWVRLVHPTEPGIPLVPTTYLAELASDERNRTHPERPNGTSVSRGWQNRDGLPA